MEGFHVAVFPHSGGSGHINPVLEFSRRLVSNSQGNFKVSFLLPDDKIPSTHEEVSIQFVSIPTTDQLSSAFKDAVVAALEALQPPPKCLISDCSIGWSQDVANRLGIPRVAIWCSNSFSEAIASNIRLLISKGYVPVHEDDTRLITFIPGIPPLKPAQLPLALRNINPAHSVHIVDAISRMKEALCVVTNGVEELEQEIVNARRAEFKHYFPVGPLIPARDIQGEDGEKLKVAMTSETARRCMAWLEKQSPRSVLYVAFGSVSSLSGEQVEKIAQALQASGVLFVWAIRRDFVTDAGEEFYGSLKTRLGSQGLVADWAPQIQVLQHKSVAAFFTHCGWNSTLEALCCGVPTICWPLRSEQDLHCLSMVEKWKMGMKVGEGTEDPVPKEEIVRVILAVMEGEAGMEMKRKVEALKTTVLAGACSERNMKEFTKVLQDHVNGNHLQPLL